MNTHTNLQWFSQVLLKVLTASLLATLLVFPVSSTRKTAHLTYAAPNASCQLAWNIVPSPPGGTGDSGLGAIGVVSAHEIWAVGSYDNNVINQMLIERWDGASWSVLPSPGAGRLLDIAVVSANDIWAVGDRFVHWDGSAWSVVTESPGANAVTALASNNVWTAGFGDTIRHWDGSRWSVIPVPEINVPIKELNDIAFVSANDGWAVGIASYGHMDYWPLVFHWDGLTWSRVQTPDETGKHLSGLATVAAGDVWAIGSRYDSGTFSTLFEHWDGTQWNIVPSPNLRTNSLWFSHASVSASDSIWAVGSYIQASDSAAKMLIEHWNGAAWSIVKSPILDAENHYLGDVVTGSQNDVWAVGSFFDGQVNQTLILHGTLPYPRAPRLVAPIHDKKISRRRVLLKWRARPCATSYNVMLRRNTTTGKTVEQVNGLTETQYKTQALVRGQTYFWRVQACNSEGCGKWSKWQSFTVSAN